MDKKKKKKEINNAKAQQIRNNPQGYQTRKMTPENVKTK